MNKTSVIFALCLLGCAGFLLPVRAGGWALVWSDEFAQADGSGPDLTKWNYNTGATGWGNNEWQYYTPRTNNARIEGGKLVIEARKENYFGSSYTSARLLTQRKWSWTYGRIEARIKIPRGQGIWPAFWMLGTNIESVGWPTCGEIDIMENVGYEPGTVHGTVHGPGYSGGGGIGGHYSLPDGAAFADDFHIYAVEWQTNSIQWFVDGQGYFTVTPDILPEGTQWVFSQPQYLLLNVAVGGNWPGYPDATTTFPQQMLVDYVRVYAATNSASATNTSVCGGNVLTNSGFEVAGLANWSVYGMGFNTLLENSNNVPVHGGSNVFKVFGQFTGVENYSGLYQDIACAGGDTFTADGWAITPAGDIIGISNNAWIEVSFRDAAANILGLYRTALVTNTTPAGVWINLAVTNQLSLTTYAVTNSVTNLVAPTGTAFVRYQLVFRQLPNSAGGAVLFDDLTLALPGSSNNRVAVSPALTGSNLIGSFSTFPGLTYQVLYKNELSDPSWQVLTNIVGDGSVMTMTDPLTANRRFYRVLCSCK